jgi:dolichyl-phosphate-mannose-protein mannosyltransferase
MPIKDKKTTPKPPFTQMAQQPTSPVGSDTTLSNDHSGSKIFSPALRTALCHLLILCIALVCYVVHLTEPPYLFWDENYHVTSAERYIEGIAQFEPHPPLGLMLIATGEALVGANKNIDKRVLITTKQIKGDDLPKGFSFAGMRLMPSLFAALGALLFFGLLYELTQNRLHALLLTSLYLFENAFVVHLRAVHLDSFQLFFSLAALWHFVRLWNSSHPLHWRQYALLALWCTLASLVKINGVVLFLIFPILYFKDAQQRDTQQAFNWLGDFAIKSGAALAAAVLTTFAIFCVHASISRTLPSADTAAGKQDLENMSPAYRTFLQRHTALTPGMVITITRDYFRFMDKDHLGVPKLDVTKPGENGSHPLHWPLHDKTINYRWDSADGKTSYVQLAGNQVSWYLGLTAVLLSLVLIVNHRVFAMPLRGSKRTYQLIEAFTGIYAAFMLLHLWIITQRVMYLYHYFLGLIISYVLAVLMWQYLCDIHPVLDRNRKPLLTCAAGAIFLSFWFFLPLSNHWPLTHDECERRNVLSRIVECNQ